MSNAVERQPVMAGFGNPVLAAALRLHAWALAVIVFMAGPVVLVVLSRMLPQGDRGLTYFWSATAGDWLLLPIAVAFSALALKDLEELGLAYLSPKLAWIPAIGALVGTCALHLLWLSDPGNVNWTQPLASPPGTGPFGLALTLNLAGWLHATFMLLMQWWIAEFVLRLGLAVVSIKRSPAVQRIDIVGDLYLRVNAVLVVSLVFGVLLARDYWDRILFPDAEQTWVWLLVPALVVVLSALINGVLLARIGRTCPSVGPGPCGVVHRRERQVLWMWIVPLAAIASALIVVSARPVLTSLDRLLPLVCVALALLASAEVWAEVYYLQPSRKPDLPGWAMIATVGLLLLAGFLLSLSMVVTQPQVTELGQIVGPWLVAFAVAMTAACGAAGLGIMLASYEAHRPGWRESARAVCGADYFGAESPRHDILQNLPQFGALHGLLPMFAAAYTLQALPLLMAGIQKGEALGTQLSLLFGYAGVVVAAVVFPLNNNMSYVRDLEAARREEQAGANRREVIEHLNADKAFTMGLTVVVGFVAAMAAMWMWVHVLDAVV